MPRPIRGMANTLKASAPPARTAAAGEVVTARRSRQQEGHGRFREIRRRRRTAALVVHDAELPLAPLRLPEDGLHEVAAAAAEKPGAAHHERVRRRQRGLLPFPL